jgi:polyisoprenoid-binding protein YceI
MRLTPLITAAAIALAFAPASAMATNWVMRPAESAIAITVTYLGSPIDAKFLKFIADISFDPADLAHSAVSVHIDTSSFDSQSEDRDDIIKNKDWFDVAKFPEARFVAKSMRVVSPGHYEAQAELTIRDVTRQVILPFTVAIAGNVARMDGTLSLKRNDFGVGQGPWSSTAEIGGDVGVSVHVVADRAK